MRELKRGRKLSREKDQRKALLKLLSQALILHGKIRTTEAKAKETARFVEKCITCAKKGGLGNRRYLLQFFGTRVVKKLVDDIAPAYKERAGGYTKIIRLGPRKSDGAKMAMIELTESNTKQK